MDWPTFILQTLVASLLSGSIISLLGGFLLKRNTEQIAAEVRQGFEQELVRFRSTLTWKEEAVSEMLGPVSMQLDRTERAFARWTGQSIYLEAKIIGEANRTIRDLLLGKAHLIPQDLLEDAGLLVEHYDRWLEEYERVRGGTEPALDQQFVFVGMQGYPFPRDSARRFQQRFHETWLELYGPRAGLLGSTPTNPPSGGL